MSSRKKSRRPSLKGSLNPSKRHRDRVNVELDNLAKLLPFPPEVIAKLDKLSVLRLSASYLRTKNFFKGLNEKTDEPSPSSVLDSLEKNGQLSDLLLEALDGFLLVLTQENEVFYASETISGFLGVSQASVIHQDFLRFVHVDDQHILENNLKLVPSPPQQKITEITEEDEKSAENGETSKEGDEVSRERSFACRFKCVLNTNAGFFKPFKCHGRLREMELPDGDTPQLALFLICSPVEVTTSILEVRMKSMLFSTKNKLDLTFVDIDQKGKQIVGYTKKDISAQSSYCMMHYDDIPILKAMHADLLSTGKCQGTFRWLNKSMKWQWLSGTGQVILKNNLPDYVITTNKPLSDEEGEEEVRRRERELGLVPTSPSTMLSHLQFIDISSPGSNRASDSPMMDTTQAFSSCPPNTAQCLLSPDPLSTSCTSEPECFSPDDLPWNLGTDSLFDPSAAPWDTNASLDDLDDIGKGDLVGEILHLDVNDLDFASDDTTVPLRHTSDTLYGTQKYSPTFNQHANLLVAASQAPGWPASGHTPDQSAMMVNQQQFPSPQYPVSLNQQRPVNNMNTMNSPMIASTYANNIPPRYTTHTISSSEISHSNPQQNGLPPASSIYSYPSMMQCPNPMLSSAASQPPSSQALFVSNHSPTGQSALLRVQTDQNRPFIKKEPSQSNSSGYFCNSIDQRGITGMMGNGVSFPGLTAPTNSNGRYHSNRLVNQGGFPAWNPAPPSPYSSASSSCSSYADPLHVQFSPTEVLTSPFASPRDDSNDGNHGNVSGPMPGHYYPTDGNYRMAPRPRARVQAGFPQPYVNIPEIAPIHMVEELVSGVHHATPISAQNANW